MKMDQEDGEFCSNSLRGKPKPLLKIFGGNKNFVLQDMIYPLDRRNTKKLKKTKCRVS